MKKTVVLGNIITVDEKRPFAKAAFLPLNILKMY